eukprot:TRINITY_DN6905_c0_g1_i4.p1 TRINITY_DN6905_c0_g1~~TRINITY_DN6905_c0_g1_i4.p1  ORF type:complete len:3289 (+),score=1230.96 TRINITY_DN6905_c0_g1_i4:82-9867(+)
MPDDAQPLVLELTASDKELISSGDAAGAVELLSQGTEARDATACRRALRVLCELCTSAAEAVAGAGAAAAALSCLRSPLFSNHAVVRQAAAALAHIASGCEAGRKACVEAGGLAVALGAMAQHQQKATVQQLCARFLAVAMHGDQAAQREVAETDGLTRLVRAASAHPDQSEVAAETLGALGVITDRGVLRQLVEDPAAAAAAAAALTHQWTGRSATDLVPRAAARLLLHLSAMGTHGRPVIVALLRTVAPHGGQFPSLPSAAPPEAVEDAAKALALLSVDADHRQLIHAEAGATAMLWKCAEGTASGVEVAAECAQVVCRLLSIPSAHSVASPELAVRKIVQLMKRAAGDTSALSSCLHALSALAQQQAAHSAVASSDDVLQAVQAVYDAHAGNTGVAVSLAGCMTALLSRSSRARRRLANFGWVAKCMKLAGDHPKAYAVVRGALSAAALMCDVAEEHQRTVLVEGGLALVTDKLSALKDPHDLCAPAADLVAALWGDDARWAVAETSVLQLLLTRIERKGPDAAACVRAIATQVGHGGVDGSKGARANAKSVAGLQGARAVYDAAAAEQASRPLRVAALHTFSALAAYAESLPCVAELPVFEAAGWAVAGHTDELAAQGLRSLALLLEAAASGVAREGGSAASPKTRHPLESEASPLRAFCRHSELVVADHELAGILASACRALARAAPAVMCSADSAAAVVAALRGCAACDTTAGRAEIMRRIVDTVTASPPDAHSLFATKLGMTAALTLLVGASSEGEATQVLRLCAAVTDIPTAEAVEDATGGGRGAALISRLGLGEMELQSVAAAAEKLGRYGRSQDAWVCAARLAVSGGEWRMRLASEALTPLLQCLEVHLSEPDPSLVLCTSSLLLSADLREQANGASPKVVPALLALTPHPDQLKEHGVSDQHRSIAWLAACIADSGTWGRVALERSADVLVRAAVEAGAWSGSMLQQAKRALKVYKARREDDEDAVAKQTSAEVEVLDTVDPALREQIEKEAAVVQSATAAARVTADSLTGRGGFQFTQEEARQLLAPGALEHFLKELRLVRFDALRTARVFACLARAVEAAGSDADAALTPDAVALAVDVLADQGHDAEVCVRGCWYLGALVASGAGGESLASLAAGGLTAVSANLPSALHSSLVGPAVAELVTGLARTPAAAADIVGSGILSGLATLLRVHSKDGGTVAAVAEAVAALPQDADVVSALRDCEMPRYLLACISGIDDEQLEASVLNAVHVGTGRIRGEHPPHPLVVGPQGIAALVELLRARWGHAVDTQRAAAAVLMDLSQAPDAWCELVSAQADQLATAAFAPGARSGAAAPALTDRLTRARLTVLLAALIPHSVEVQRAMTEDEAAAAVLRELEAGRGHGEAELSCLVAAELMCTQPRGRDALAARGVVAALAGVARRTDPPPAREAACAALEALANLATAPSLREVASRDGGLEVALAALQKTPQEDTFRACVAAAVVANTCVDCEAAQKRLLELGGTAALSRSVMRWERCPKVLRAVARIFTVFESPEAKLKGTPCVGSLCAALRSTLHQSGSGVADAEVAAACAATLGAIDSLCRGCGANQDAAGSAGADVLCDALHHAARAQPSDGVTEMLRRALGLAATVAFADVDPSTQGRLASSFAFAATAAVRMPLPLAKDGMLCATSFVGAGLDSATRIVDSDLLKVSADRALSNASLQPIYADLIRGLAAEEGLRNRVGAVCLGPLLRCVQRAERDPVTLARALAALQLLLHSAECQSLLLNLPHLPTPAGNGADASCVVLAKVACFAAGRGYQEVLRLAVLCLAAVPVEEGSGAREAAELLCRATKVHAQNRAAVSDLCRPLARWGREDAATRAEIRSTSVLDVVLDMLHDAAGTDESQLAAAPVLVLGAELYHNEAGARAELLLGPKAVFLDALLSAIPRSLDPQSPALQAIGWCLAVAVLHGDDTVIDRVVAVRGASAIAVAAQSPLILSEDRRFCGEAVEKIRVEEAARATEAGLSLEELRAATRRAERAQQAAERSLRDQTADYERAKHEAAECKDAAQIAERRLQDQRKLLADEKVKAGMELESALADAKRQHRAEMTAMEEAVRKQLLDSGILAGFERQMAALKLEIEELHQEKDSMRAAHAAEAAAMAEMQQQELREYEDRYRQREATTMRQRQWELDSLSAERRAVAEREQQTREEVEEETRELHRSALEEKTRAEILKNKVTELSQQCATQERQLWQRDEEAKRHAAEIARIEKAWQERMAASVSAEESRAKQKQDELRAIHQHRESELSGRMTKQAKEMAADKEEALDKQMRKYGGLSQRQDCETGEAAARKAVKLQQRAARLELVSAKDLLLKDFLSRAQAGREAAAAAAAKRPEVLRRRQMQRAMREREEKAMMEAVDGDADAVRISAMHSRWSDAILRLTKAEAEGRAAIAQERKQVKRELRCGRLVQLRDSINVPMNQIREEIGGQYAAWATERDVSWRRHAEELEAACARRVKEVQEIANAQQRQVAAKTAELHRQGAAMQRQIHDAEHHHKQERDVIASQLAQARSDAQTEHHQKAQREGELSALRQERDAAERRWRDHDEVQTARVAAELEDMRGRAAEASQRAEALHDQVESVQRLRREELDSMRAALSTASREGERVRREAAELREAQQRQRALSVDSLCSTERLTRQRLQEIADSASEALHAARLTTVLAAGTGASSVLQGVYQASEQCSAVRNKVLSMVAHTERGTALAGRLATADALLMDGGEGMVACAMALYRCLVEDAAASDDFRLVRHLAEMGVAAADSALACSTGGPQMLSDGVWGLAGHLCERLQSVDEEYAEMRRRAAEQLARVQHAAEMAQEHVRILQSELSTRERTADPELRSRAEYLEQQLTAANRASQQVIDGLVASHEAEIVAIRQQLRAQEDLTDRLRTVGDPDIIHPKHAEQLQAASARSRKLEDEARGLARSVALLKERLREAEEGREAARVQVAKTAEQLQKAEAQRDSTAAALRRAEADNETVRAARKSEQAEWARQADEERRAAHNDAARLEAKWEEQQVKVAALQHRVRRREEQREDLHRDIAELRAAGLDVCLTFIARQKEHILELETTLGDAREQCDRMKREKDSALGEMERAIEKESHAMAKYLKVLAAKDGVLQRGKELDRRAWEVSVMDKDVERREALVRKREVEIKRGAMSGTAVRPDRLPRLPGVGWPSERLREAETTVAMSREDLYTHGMPRPVPCVPPPVTDTHASDAQRQLLLHRPLKPLRGVVAPDRQAGLSSTV